MSRYTIQAGAPCESAPSGQILNAYGNANWFDFGATAVAVDTEGFCEVRKAGFRHAAVRTCGRESTHKPSAANIAPRARDWKKQPAIKK